jgi:hypothetical protein
MVKYVRMDTISFAGNTSAQADHENRSMKSSGETNPMFALVISFDDMMSKTQQRYLMKLCEARKDIISVPLSSKKKEAKDLTKLGEGLVLMEWSERDHYVIMRLSQMVYLVARMGMVLPSERFPGGRQRYIRLRIVNFDVDDTVTCSFKYHKRVDIPCRRIIAIVGDVLCSMIDVRWRKSLQACFGLQGFDKITIILWKALKYKKKPCRCIRPASSATYPWGGGGGAEEKYVVPFEKHGHFYRSFLELKVYVNALKPAEQQVVF